MSEGEITVYEIVGGDETFKKLVDEFYARVEQDDRLRALFPEDLEAGKHWQYLFLRQFFGGPAEYHSERGHPRLRMRHAPFKIDEKARDAWLAHMLSSIDAVGIQEPERQMMRSYFERAATHMINSYIPNE
ncbi:MAG: globin [Aggregatilineales bacterium]